MNPVRFASREEWLRARRIGSSDVAAILGVSPHRAGWDVLGRFRGHAPDVDSVAMERGRRLEPAILRAYSHRTGVDVRPPPSWTLFAREHWATATPDGLPVDVRIRRAVEAKTDRDSTRWGDDGETIARWEAAAGEIVRPDYYLQLQHQLWVLDLPEGALAVLVPGSDPFTPELRIFRIFRDDDVCAQLVTRLRAWWDRHVVGGEDLPWDGSWAATRELAERDRDGRRPATPDEVAKAASYAVASRAEDAWKAERKRIGQELIASAGGASRLDFGGGHLTVVRSQRSTLDEYGLRREHPELGPLLDKYRRPGDPYIYPKVALGGRS